MARLAIYALFFASGACALTYELVWLRWFAAVFGVAHYATAVVVAAMMAGLAVGGAWGGRRFERSHRPLRAYARMELGLGAYALLTPWLIDRAAVAAGSPLSVRVLVCLAVLAVPTVLMGATLPALVSHFAGRPSRVGPSTARLYAFNTAGAVTGVLLAGFVLLPRLGALSTNLSAALASLAIGAAALALATTADTAPATTEEPAPDSSPDPEPIGGPAVIMTAAVAGLSGFVGIGAELVWLRALAIYLHDTIFAYTITLATFLAGIALGAAAAAALCRGGAVRPIALAATQVGLGLCLVLSPFVLRGLLGPGDGSPLDPAVLAPLAGAASTMFVPALLLGASVPLAVDLYARGTGQRAQAAGRIYAANTLGAIAGSLGVGLLLVPSIGSTGSTLCLVVVASASAVVASRISGHWLAGAGSRMVAATATALALTAALGLGRGWELYFPMDPPPGLRIVFHREDASGLVEVLEADDGLRKLVTDRKNAWGDTSPLMRHSMRRQGYLPLLLHPRPTSVVEIGLATGINFAPAVLDTRVQRAQMVEISPAVVEAAGWFAEHNAQLLTSPKVEVFIADGRNHLQVTSERYDVIILGLFVPYRPGAGNLFTAQMYATAKSRLGEGGLVVHWLPLDQLTGEALAAVVAAFAGGFEVAHAWEREQYLALVGSSSPIDFDLDRIARVMTDPSIASDLKRHGLADAAGFIASYMMGRDGLLAFAGDARPNTDDSVVVEFQSLDSDKSGAYAYATGHLAALLEHRELPAGLSTTDDGLRERVRRAFAAREHFLRGALAQVAGDHREALMRFQMAAKLNPADAQARAQLRGYRRRGARSRER